LLGSLNFLFIAISSTDESLLDILVDMATTENLEEDIGSTPLLETTFMNNGR